MDVITYPCWDSSYTLIIKGDPGDLHRWYILCRVNTYWFLSWASCQIRKNAGCTCAGNTGNVSPFHHRLAIPTCIAASMWRTCRDVFRDRKRVVSFEAGGGENVPGIPGACANHNLTYLVTSPWGRIPAPFLCWEMIENAYILFCFLKLVQQVQG